ncbi:MAG: hypothetical protein O9262_08025 [Cyclobacteriaceae bacterium]|nr:hypothetical protein [Cyclobacteriaceae bacterium]
MRPIILLFTFLILGSCCAANAQNIASSASKKCILFLNNGIGFIGLDVKGNLILDENNLSFIPAPKSFLFQYNEQIKSIVIPLNDIKNIRRNWCVLIPSRLIVTTTKRERFRFVMFGKRKTFIDPIKNR